LVWIMLFFDAQQVSNELEQQSDLNEDIKAEAIEDVDQIAADAKEMETASPARAKNLRLAINKRMEALTQLLHSQEEDEEAPVAKVANDLAQVTAAVKASHLSGAHKAKASNILAKITANVKQVASGHMTSSIKNHMRHELEELKQIVNAENKKPVAATKSFEEEDAVARVVSDVDEIRNKLHSAHMPSAKQHEAKANLDRILRDAEEMSSASADRRHTLHKAMMLRVAALREQLN